MDPDANCLGWQKGRGFVVSSDTLCSFFLADDAKGKTLSNCYLGVLSSTDLIHSVCSNKQVGRK